MSSFKIFDIAGSGPVSYTHLDVYKRQVIKPFTAVTLKDKIDKILESRAAATA